MRLNILKTRQRCRTVCGRRQQGPRPCATEEDANLLQTCLLYLKRCCNACAESSVMWVLACVTSCCLPTLTVCPLISAEVQMCGHHLAKWLHDDPHREEVRQRLRPPPCRCHSPVLGVSRGALLRLFLLRAWRLPIGLSMLIVASTWVSVQKWKKWKRTWVAIVSCNAVASTLLVEQLHVPRVRPRTQAVHTLKQAATVHCQICSAPTVPRVELKHVASQCCNQPVRDHRNCFLLRKVAI